MTSIELIKHTYKHHYYLTVCHFLFFGRKMTNYIAILHNVVKQKEKKIHKYNLHDTRGIYGSYKIVLC